jgi:hypothetical protein
VDGSYEVPFRFTGKLDKLTCKLGPSQVSIGRFSQEEVDIADENALTLLDGVLLAGGTLARREGPQHKSRNRASILEARSVVSSLYSAASRHPEAGSTQVD